MLGAIAGDIAGSRYEFNPVSKDCHWNDFELFPANSHFTDDTVMTLAVAEALRKAEGKDNLQPLLIDSMHEFGSRWPHSGYGGRFRQWLRQKNRLPYNSFGNGSAMRVSPVGWLAATLQEAEKLAEQTACVTHNHPEGIKGAQSVAGAIFMARNGASKDEIKDYVQRRYGYDLSRGLCEIQPCYEFDETCQGSVPEAFIAFLESGTFEDALRKAIWLGGDADTQAAITGSIAEAFYGIPEEISSRTISLLGPELSPVYLRAKDWLEKYRKP